MVYDCAYWIKEFLAIFFADISAGFLIYKLFDSKLEKRNEYARMRQFSILAGVALVQINLWLNKYGVSAGQMTLTADQRDIPYGGIEKIFDPACDWNFEGFEPPLNTLAQIQAHIGNWNSSPSKTVLEFESVRKMLLEKVELAKTQVSAVKTSSK